MIKKELITNDNCLLEKVMNLCLCNQVKESQLWIEQITHQIKICELRKEHLLFNKPFKFQKKKMLEYDRELKKINETILKYYNEIEKEISIISKLNKSIRL